MTLFSLAIPIHHGLILADRKVASLVKKSTSKVPSTVIFFLKIGPNLGIYMR
jgi:hypothetical protein